MDDGEYTATGVTVLTFLDQNHLPPSVELKQDYWLFLPMVTKIDNVSFLVTPPEEGDGSILIIRGNATHGCPKHFSNVCLTYDLCLLNRLDSLIAN
ncbi:hypothetical protein L2E82_40340 [Cichorium intybus]|uniref:Uncharacterized protein n=1 Tax=Cichorium intybus TaxID=13427 RepID=A0ACB9AK31_CICIN|nr:hypothetical protein L2E82_40340 [Cichorium intybus]